MRLIFYFLVGLLLGGSCTYALGQTSAVVTLKSYHFDRSKGYNERNLGVGLEHQLSPDLSLATGFYENSISRTTTYVWAGYTPLHVGSWNFGAVVGGGTGYECGLRVCPMAALLVQHRWFNIAIVPQVVAVQVKWRF